MNVSRKVKCMNVNRYRQILLSLGSADRYQAELWITESQPAKNCYPENLTKQKIELINF